MVRGMLHLHFYIYLPAPLPHLLCIARVVLEPCCTSCSVGQGLAMHTKDAMVPKEGPLTRLCWKRTREVTHTITDHRPFSIEHAPHIPRTALSKVVLLDALDKQEGLTGCTPFLRGASASSVLW